MNCVECAYRKDDLDATPLAEEAFRLEALAERRRANIRSLMGIVAKQEQELAEAQTQLAGLRAEVGRLSWMLKAFSRSWLLRTNRRAGHREPAR